MNNVKNTVMTNVSIAINFVKENYNKIPLTPIQKKVALISLGIFAGVIALIKCCNCKFSVVKSTPLKIESEADLEKVLNEHKIDLTKWTKKVSDLYNEIKGGECTLELHGKELVRTVNVVSVRCFAEVDGHRLQLIEKKQVYNTGKVVERKLGYLVEKIKPGEKPSDAAIRGIAEELKISGKDVKVKAQETKITEAKSKAYAGLQGIYNAHYFSFEMNKDQYKETYEEKQTDKTSYFEWIRI